MEQKRLSPPGDRGNTAPVSAADWLPDPADSVAVALVHSTYCPGLYLGGPCTCTPRLQVVAVSTASDAMDDDDDDE